MALGALQRRLRSASSSRAYLMALASTASASGTRSRRGVERRRPAHSHHPRCPVLRGPAKDGPAAISRIDIAID